MNFFRYFPTRTYVFEDVTLDITDITARVKLMERIKARTSVFYDYIVEGEDRPDSVATKVYGGPQYTWVVLVVNNILSLYDWPLTTREFDAFIKEKYGSTMNAENLSNNPVYFTADGYEVDATTWLTLAEMQGNVMSRYDYELARNEAKRRIKVIPASLVGPLTTELKKVLA